MKEFKLVKINPETHQKLKVLAAQEKSTLENELEKIIKKAVK